jgi:hypothetical protein
MSYSYYYNNVPEKGLCRNNLIYTSLINEDKTVFCQWYYNDSDYHKGKNQVVDASLMNEKWQRELKYITLMNDFYPEHIPKILDINHDKQKLFLEIQGVDFWEQAGCSIENHDSILPDWQDQMLEIFKAHKALGLYKYSLHPSSYFIVNGKLKSINYFFTYAQGESNITVRDHLSHISQDRQVEIKIKTDAMGINWDTPQTLHTMQMLTFASFSNNYPSEFIEKAIRVFNS